MLVFKFNKAQYIAGEDVVLEIPDDCENIEVEVFELSERVYPEIQREGARLRLKGLKKGNYGIRLYSSEESCEGAFDVVNDSRDIVRYGFLSDFSSKDEETCDVEWMKDLHINAVQFYDWMYRHDDLVPSEKEYTDPLGREMSLEAITQKINACKGYGMRPFAYGAVYAATKETFAKHPEWGMYTMDGEPMVFADWLHFMNISPECGWSEHILEEYRKAIELGFSGIHMDTYGFPKQVWDCNGKSVELEEKFKGLISSAAGLVKQQDEKAGVIFNAVNNWPVESVAREDQDSVYIEVWPPNDTYYDLYTLIREAKLISGKNVILAAYLKSFLQPDNERAMSSWRLCWAAVSALGGTQLVLGENRGVLRDSYYVNYGKLQKQNEAVIQKYCDFQVRYADLLYDDHGSDITKTASCGINEDICIKAEGFRISCKAEPDSVWTVIRGTSKRITINFINLTGNDSEWNKPKNEPAKVSGIEISFRLDRKLKGIFVASPDSKSLAPVELAFDCEKTGQGRIYHTRLDSLQYWSAVWLETE